MRIAHYIRAGIAIVAFFVIGGFGTSLTVEFSEQLYDGWVELCEARTGLTNAQVDQAVSGNDRTLSTETARQIIEDCDLSSLPDIGTNISIPIRVGPT